MGSSWLKLTVRPAETFHGLLRIRGGHEVDVRVRVRVRVVHDSFGSEVKVQVDVLLECWLEVYYFVLYRLSEYISMVSISKAHIPSN